VTPPATPGIPGTRLPEPLPVNVHQTIHALTNRVANVEHHTTQLVDNVNKIKEATDRFAGYEAMIKHLMSKGVLLILGAIGSTYGVTRATTPAPAQEHVQIVKSATTVKVEACTAMQPGPERDRCALAILADLMSPAAH